MPRLDLALLIFPFFSSKVEKELQDVSGDCTLTIPYFDWTLDVGHPSRSLVWSVSYFGGDGRWDGCVRYHPFKDYHPPFLAPCLRRRFNEDVQLPDMINVQLALNEPDYETFRITMEAFAKVLMTFVGGERF